MSKPIILKTDDYWIEIAPDEKKIVFYSRRIHMDQIIRGNRVFTLSRSKLGEKVWNTITEWMKEWN